MNLGLRGKTALVTGGARGLGKAIADGLRDEGASVSITSREMGIDISIDGEARFLVDAIGSVDILINNIGDTLGITDPHCSIEDYRRVMRLNFEVAVEMSELCLPAMKQKGWGRIVHISSNAGLENSGPVPYCAAKAALTAYGRSMGRVLAMESPNVVMSVVHPGVFWTEGGFWDKASDEHREKYLRERCPLGRLGRPEELVPQVLLLCSEQATFMHGAVVPVDAGQARHYFGMA